MKDLTGSEEIVIKEVATPLEGLAFKIQQHISFLEEIQKTAVTLESGLDTKSGIVKFATLLRKGLYAVHTDIHNTYTSALVVKKNLLDTVETVQKANKKAALAAQIAENQAKLGAL